MALIEYSGIENTQPVVPSVALSRRSQRRIPLYESRVSPRVSVSFASLVLYSLGFAILVQRTTSTTKNEVELIKTSPLLESRILMNRMLRELSPNPLSFDTNGCEGMPNCHRRDQTDPCDGMLSVVNSCLPASDPTCDDCVTSSFDAFLSNIPVDFSCDDYMTGVCPILYQNCTCAPCNTELETYFNCVLNDARDNTCPTVFCDPLKNFDATPEPCLDEAAFASACVDFECLMCLDDAIATGVPCSDLQQMTCAAIYTNCVSCLECLNVVEPWLSCVAQESYACDPFDCQKSEAPSAAPGVASIQPVTGPQPVLVPSQTTSVPQAAIVDTPSVSAPIANVMAPPTLNPDLTVRDILSMGETPYTIGWSNVAASFCLFILLI
jgi:hypothetical protein